MLWGTIQATCVLVSFLVSLPPPFFEIAVCVCGLIGFSSSFPWSVSVKTELRVLFLCFPSFLKLVVTDGVDQSKFWVSR